MSLFGDCPKCKKGIMRPDLSFAYSTLPKQYEWTCEKCGYKMDAPIPE